MIMMRDDGGCLRGKSKVEAVWSWKQKKDSSRASAGQSIPCESRYHDDVDHGRPASGAPFVDWLRRYQQMLII